MNDNYPLQKVLFEHMWLQAQKRGIDKEFPGWEVALYYNPRFPAWELVGVNKNGAGLRQASIWLPAFDDARFERMSLKMGRELIKRRMSEASRNLHRKIYGTLTELS